MILREGDKVKRTESGIVYEVKKIHDKGFIILSSEDGSRTALMNMKDVDLYFSRISVCVTES
jgi:preprotein translocase subunit YajC